MGRRNDRAAGRRRPRTVVPAGLVVGGLVIGLVAAAVSTTLSGPGSPTGVGGASPVVATQPAARTDLAPAGATAGTADTAGTASASPDGGTATVTTAATGCGRKAGRRTVTRTTRITLPQPAVGNGGQSDTEPLPMAITPRAGGGSWLAWLGTGGRVHLGKLDCRDRLTGTPTSFVGIDLQDVRADRTGGVLLLTRKGSCRGGTLCGGAASPCNTMHMVRFDNDGRTVWTRQVTNLNSARGGYTPGARFVWWYQHHGRLAYDGRNYAAYFGVAITVRNGTCVDIHQGDRMQVVDNRGRLLAGHDSFDVGCSHSWTTRIVWDPRTRHFVSTCATDNQCRVARPSPYRTVAAGRCDGTLFGGDLVLATGRGYWAAWSQGGRVRLNRFGAGAGDRAVTAGQASAHPHLVAYRSGRMLLVWGSGSRSRAQVYDAARGTAIGGTVPIAVQDHAYQAWKAYSDGSVAFPAAGAGVRRVTIARVLPAAG